MERLTRLAAAGLALACALAVAPAPAAAQGGEPARAQAEVVDRVRLVVPPGEDPAALQPLVGIEVGRPLSRRAARRTVLLLQQLGRFADVVVRTGRGEGGGLEVTVECVPRRAIRAVRVREAGPLGADRVLRASGLATGQELHGSRLDAAADAIRAEYRRRGWRAAEVRIDAPGAGRESDLEISVAAGPPTRVASFVVQGAAPVAGLRTRAGAPFDEQALDEDVAALREALRARGHLRSRVDPPAVELLPDGAHVTLRADPGPRIRFRFAGQRAASPERLQAELGLDPGQPLDAAAIDAAAARLRAFYLRRGHADVRVASRELAAGGDVTVLFELHEGPRYRVREVRFTGAASRDPARLRAELLAALAAGDGGGEGADAERAAKAIGSRLPARAEPPFRPAETWEPAAWDLAVARLVDGYRADGFLEATHEGTRVALDARARRVDVEVALREGPRTVVSSVTFDGNAVLTAAELAREARLAAGGPLSWAAVEQTRAAVLGLYGRRGHLYARVVDAERFSDDRTSAEVRFTVDEGPQVKVANVVVSGAKRTKEDVVRDSVQLRPGDVYDPTVAAKSQAALLRLGVFRSVGLRLSDPDVPEAAKDLTVDVAERPWRSLSPGVGFSIANGPRAFVELVQPNLFGRAIEGSARAKVNYPLETFRPDLADRSPADRIEFRADAGIHDPRVRLLPIPAGARASATVERVHRRAYDLARGAALVGLDVAATSRASISLQYEVEIDHVVSPDDLDVPLTRADVERLRFPEGYTTLQSVRPVVTLDFRDHPVHPRRGWFASGTLDWVRSVGTGDDSWLFGLVKGSGVYTNMLKLSSTLSGYLPLGKGSVLALSVRGGRVFPIDSGSRTIGPKRFFLGGSSTMRGYGEDEMLPIDLRDALLAQRAACLEAPGSEACASSEAGRRLASGRTVASEGGESFALAKVELRMPVRGAVEAGVFADVGNLWLDPRLITFDLASVRLNVGAGLRFLTPIGPAALDFGVNVTQDERLGERLFAPHFSIGLF
jgi:outer membrane protein assembly factor BamA